MYLNSFIKYNTNVSIKILFSTIKIIGNLGILEQNYSHYLYTLNLYFNNFYFIYPLKSFIYKNSFILSNLYINTFFADFFKLIFGVTYG